MTNEEAHQRKLTSHQREVIEQMTEAGLSKMSAVKSASPPTDMDKVANKLKSVHFAVAKTMQPILNESNKKGIHDHQADKEMLASLYLQQLDTLFDKEELVYLLTAFITEQVFEKL